jgi:hypothetical protein
MVNGESQDQSESLWRKLVLPEEDRRCQPDPPPWTGSYRWFRSPNVVDLWAYRGAAEKQRITNFMWQRQLEEMDRFRVLLAKP